MVWNLSRFYNTPERLTVLLRKLSNEIINRCCSVISLPDVFSGDVDNVMTALRQSMEAGGLLACCLRDPFPLGGYLFSDILQPAAITCRECGASHKRGLLVFIYAHAHR